MAMTTHLHGAHHVREFRTGVTECWRSAPRREQRQTLATLGLVLIVATLILAGLLV